MARRVSNMLKFIDIGANLTDTTYQGNYYGRVKHPNDLDMVLNRANSAGVERILVTGGSLWESKEALEIAANRTDLFTTVGCHPTRCNEFLDNPKAYLHELENLIWANQAKVVALGELGLDYDRTKFCPVNVQKEYFALQLTLCERVKLPLFLHSRACHEDFVTILKYAIKKQGILRGVVHSFTGSLQEAEQLIEMGFYIGINGCSLKTEENVQMAKALPLDKILIETDAPWCEIKPTHASFQYVKTKFQSQKAEKWNTEDQVKGRNEPANIVQVFEVLCALHREHDPQELADLIYKNTLNLFFDNK